MTDKERMKEYVLFAQGAGRKFFATEPIPFMDRTARMLLALIDRVPSEEDKAEIDNWMRSLRIGDPESDDDALHVWHILTTIRKSLGIEGKE